MSTGTAKKATSIRLDRDLYSYIEELAKREHRSLNNFIETTLSRATHYDTSNQETKEAMAELKRGDGDAFHSVKDLFESVS